MHCAASFGVHGTGEANGDAMQTHSGYQPLLACRWGHNGALRILDVCSKRRAGRASTRFCNKSNGDDEIVARLRGCGFALSGRESEFLLRNMPRRESIFLFGRFLIESAGCICLCISMYLYVYVCTGMYMYVDV